MAFFKQDMTSPVYIPSAVFAGTGKGDYMAAANCVASDFFHPKFKEFCETYKHPHQLHRKLWEWAYVYHHLKSEGALVPGARGLGFGVGQERLPALFASMGCHVVATDAPAGVAEGAGWRETNQHSAKLDDLFAPEHVDRSTFEKRVSIAECDMNAIGDGFRGYDFCWSACSFEHLGSIELGLDFVVNSVEQTLKPGGVAVHTTELNLSSNGDTITSGATVLFRRQDLEALERRLTDRGHVVRPFRLELGLSYIDSLVDVPPYTAEPHLKLLIGKYVTTSVGIVVERGAA